jgi:hypothetical protein
MASLVQRRMVRRPKHPPPPPPPQGIRAQQLTAPSIALQGGRRGRWRRSPTRRPRQDQQVQPPTPARNRPQGGTPAQKRKRSTSPNAHNTHTRTHTHTHKRRPYILTKPHSRARAQKEKEELDDISTELELADEDEKIPCAYYPPLRSLRRCECYEKKLRYG